VHFRASNATIQDAVIFNPCGLMTLRLSVAVMQALKITPHNRKNKKAIYT